MCFGIISFGIMLDFIKNHGGYWFGHLPYIRQAIIKIEDWINNKGRPTWNFRQFLARSIHYATGNTIFYLDYELGSDANDGSTWALAWKTITTGATAARIAPGDVIRIAKSPAPVSVGNATWNNLSKTVTLASAQTLGIDYCEVIWTGTGDTTVALVAVATDAKEGSYCIRLTLDASPQISILQAYHATGALNLSAYQKISFWIKNSAAIVANNWKVCLCSDTAGATVVDTFLITAIPSTARWLPLTLARVGGGNLGASIQSIAVYTDTVAPTASSNILIDDFIACTTSGLNLQSLISKNSAEQGGTEGWFGIQSINGVTVLLDNETNTKANGGQGYSGTTETVTTYKRETTKTDLVATTAIVVQAVQDSGTVGSNIEFQGGYDTSTTLQTGETFFDGLNGNGYGLSLGSNRWNITLNYLNLYRYNYGLYLNACPNNLIPNLSNVNNNTNYGIVFFGQNNIVTILSNANNNGSWGVYFNSSNDNKILTLLHANNNTVDGVYSIGGNNIIKLLSTANNGINGVYSIGGALYLENALIAEAAEVGSSSFANSRVFSYKHDQTDGNFFVFTDGGVIFSQTATRHTASGIAWDLNVSSANRVLAYPLDLKIAEIAVNANNLVTVKAWFKKSAASTIGAKLVCKGGQLAGVPNDVVATKADDTNWEELTITFTPTEAGILEIEAWAYYISANGNIFVDDITVTQS